MESLFSKRYSVETLRHACCVVSLLTKNASGYDAASIKRECGFSPKQTELVIKALIACGAVLRRSELPPVANRGARRRFVYFLACSPTRWGDGGGPRELDELEEEEVEDAAEETEAAESVIRAPDYSPEKVETGEIIEPEKGEIIGAPFSININTKEIEINKRARVGRAYRKNTEYKNTGSGARMNALVASVALDDSESVSLRRQLAEIVWDSESRAELFDRAVAAVRLGYARPCDMLARARRAAIAAKNAGVAFWRKFTLDVKQVFELAGVEWTPTRAGLEPSPFRLVSLRLNESSDELDGVEIRRVDGRNVVVFGTA